MSGTDELREQIAEMIADYHGRSIQAHTLFRSYELAGELLPLVVAVVAEARTEGAIAELEYLSADTAKTLQVWTPSDLNERAAALRGVGNQKVGVTVDDLALDEMDGNQNAEPRWSANRLEEVLREGLPDQNAEPEWEWGYGHESESGLVPVLGFEGPYSEGRSRDIAEKQMNDDLRWRYPLALMKRRKAGPWLPADQKGTEQ